MTISSTNRKAGPYSGTGAQTAFPFAFKVFATSDVLVVRTDALGVETPLKLGTDYSVALNADQNGSPGGTVNLVAAAPSGNLVTIGSSVPLTQGQSIPNQGGFYPKVIENALDKITIGMQQLAEKAARSLQFAFSDTVSGSLPTAAQRANNLLAFDASGNPIAVAPAAQSATALQGLLSASGGSALVGFIQANANAVARKAQDKVREMAFSPEDFGATGDGVTDDTVPLGWMAACLRAAGGGKISFGSGKTYRVLPTGGASGNKLMDFTGIAGLTIEGNGARILTGSVTLSQTAVCLDSASLVRISNLKFESQYQVLTSAAGIDWIAAGNGAHELVFENIDLKWGVCGIVPRGPAVGSGTDTNRTRNIVVRNLTTFGTYYPINLQGAGDNLTANVRSRNAGRSFFAYNVRNCDVAIDSEHGGPFSDVLIKCYGSTTWDSRTENIRLRYATRTRYAGSGNQSADEALVAIDFQLDATNPAACKIQDVEIVFDVDTSTVDRMQSLFVVRKYDNTGSADSVAGRGHELVNLALRGAGRSLQNMLGDAVRLFTRAPDNWNGESIYNVRVDGLSLGTIGGKNSITIDGSGLLGSCSIRDVGSAGNLSYSNMSGKDFAVDSSSFGNYPQFTRVPKDYTATWTADTTNPVLGTGTLQTKYSVRNGWCTVTGRLSLGGSTTTGAGNWHISLPFAHTASDYAIAGSAKGLVAGSFYTGACEIQPGANTLELMLGGSTGNYVNASTPATWASGHHVEFTITYPIG